MQMIGFVWVVFRVVYFGICVYDLEFVCWYLFFVVYVVLVFYCFFQYIGQDFYVFVWVGIEVLIGVDDVVVNYLQGGEVYKVWVIIVGERESMSGIQLVMVSVVMFVCFV